MRIFLFDSLFILSVPNLNGASSAKSTVVRNGHASVLYVQIEKLEHIPLSEQCMETALGLKWRCEPGRFGVVHLSSTTLNTNELIALQVYTVIKRDLIPYES